MSGSQKINQRAKNCIKLCAEYVEYIPSLVPVACLLPGRAKDLSATPRVCVCVCVGWDSSVGIASRYGSDEPGIESR